MILNWLRNKIHQLKERSTAPHYMLTVNEEGFVRLKEGEPVASVKWADVVQIATYKRDLFAIDQICLAFFFEHQDLQADRWDNVVETTEDDEGFKDLCSMLEKHYPSISKEWYGQIAFPAFAHNTTLLYRR